ncbi:hypothetical protein C5167_035570 [Papaver somniferum]|uniref:Protein kinase domain-containing protein n=1 Tax=Papaver somniferum TaxID=3469 RepID=A0A4Y7KHN2_PAPSO|nr:hypothetical protein C5167_035570 [Papaver somniferum]
METTKTDKEVEKSDAGSSGSIRKEDMMARADGINLRNSDTELEMRLTGASSSRGREVLYIPTEEWEIDLSKLCIKDVIAHGSYGSVYSKGVYDGQDVAVKVLDWGADGIATTAVRRASFDQEVAIWHDLDHPNVTKFIGASMGTSNLEIPSRDSGGSGSLPATACCFVVDLSYLHSKHIAHRNVKTENLLLDANGTLKIAGFGVARVEAQNPSDMSGATGTLGYMAPEVLRGDPYDRKCDVYSFGICLWEIYCCDMPYPDLSLVEVSSAVVQKRLPPEIPRCCPSALTNIMQRCLNGYPGERPHMDEVVRLLEALDTSKGGGMIPEDQKCGFFCFGVARGP